MDEELRTPNTVRYIAKMIAELGPKDREQLFNEVLPQELAPIPLPVDGWATDKDGHVIRHNV